MNTNNPTLRHIIVKFWDTRSKEKILKCSCKDEEEGEKEELKLGLRATLEAR